MNPLQIALAAVVVVSVCGCTNSYVKDCPEGEILGQDLNRLRTASYRSKLDNSPVAAQRFVHLAAMSGLAYWHERKDCEFEDHHLSKDDADELEGVLREVSGDTPWQPFTFDRELGLPTECQDKIGLFFRVWRRPTQNGRDDVVIAFRGTSNGPDWVYGNLWWITRFFVWDNQYSRSTEHLEVVLKQLHDDAQRAGKPDPRVVVTGHSLGGGLAQHALYNFPSAIKQAIVFDPSSVTGYVKSRHGKEVLECGCDSELKTEARIIRVYESDEILSSLRIWHKIFFPSHLQIQEVRFAFYNGHNSIKAHGMRDLTRSMHAESKKPITETMTGKPWYASLTPGCTQQIEDAQRTACAALEKVCNVP